jgi:ABC-type Zn uptake system ZnuABC Zn-binding protein ZnuA
MYRRSTLSLVIWLALFGWLISACGPAQAPPTGEASQPTSAEEHEVGHEQDGEHEAAIVKLEPVSLDASDKLRVIATTNIVADIVSQVGGDSIELTALLPLGADPHTYTTSPQDMVAVTDAHLIFANGVNLEAEFLPELIQHSEVPVIYVSQGIELRALGEDETREHENADPHTWTTPTNAIVFVHNIEHALSAADPANAETYMANAEKYEVELERFDEWIEEQISTIPVNNRKLITDHDTFGYYTDRYGLEQIGAVIPGFSTASEPSAQELAALEDMIREYGVRAVFVGTTVNPSLAQQVVEDTGIQLINLYTGSLGPAGSGVETYLDYIRHNTTAIVEGLRY